MSIVAMSGLCELQSPANARIVSDKLIMEEPTQKQMTATRARTTNLINKGILVRPKNCEICEKGTWRIMAHHFSYEVDNIVIWVCGKCHQKFHARYYDDLSPEDLNFNVYNSGGASWQFSRKRVEKKFKSANKKLFIAKATSDFWEKTSEVLIRKLVLSAKAMKK